MKKIIAKFLKKIDLRMERISYNPNFMDLLINLLNQNKINLVLDAGANNGQFATKIIINGYNNGKIISFEPVSKAHDSLLLNSKKYKNWEVFDRCALGDNDGETIINVSNYDLSSSILPMTNLHLEKNNASFYVSKEKVKIFRLDSIFDKVRINNENTFLKLDVQGYESKVLHGAINSLKIIKGLMLEVSIAELYKGEELWLDIVSRIIKMNFELYLIEKGFYDKKNNKLLQLDLVFFKKDNVIYN
jgi:FkbM family methyltransferase